MDRNDFRRIFEGGRLPVIRQAEAAECGLACLVMAANYFGHGTSMSEMRRRFSTSLKGTTLKTLMEMGHAVGLSSRAVRLELHEIGQLKTPAILHWDLNHYVVLKGVGRRSIVIHDPGLGERAFSFESASRHFTGVALELTPTPAFQKRQIADRVEIGDLFRHVQGITPMVGQLFLLALILQAFNMLSPILNQTIVDDVLGRGDADLLTTVTLGMIVLLVIDITLNRLRSYISLYMNTQLSFQMNARLLGHVLRLPVSWFEKRHIGDILSRFGSIAPAQAVMTDSLPSAILDSVIAVFAVAVMVLYAPLLTGVECLAIGVLFGVRLITFPYFRRQSAEILHANASVQSTFLETLRGARTIKAFGQERERISLWQNEQINALNKTVQTAKFNLWGGAGTGLLNGIQQIITWYLGARMVMDGRLTIGMLFAFQSYTGQFVNSAERLVSQFFTWRTLSIHLERLADIIHAEPERGIDDPTVQGRPLAGRIDVRNLSFRYADHDPWVLRGVTLCIEPGEFVCLTGPSGQGKTTLLKLLLGFYEPTEGEVLVDGVPLHVFGVRAYRDRIGVVLQDDQLFAGTIADNIAFFDPQMDMARVEEAARIARIADDILRLPMGFLSLVGDMGSALSGGQRQRLFLARALYRNPSILFLDEGTANLDPECERQVMDTLQDFPGTRIVIAHREAAIAAAGRIVTIHNSEAS